MDHSPLVGVRDFALLAVLVPPETFRLSLLALTRHLILEEEVLEFCKHLQTR